MNILQFFESPVEQGDPTMARDNLIFQIHFGRLKASKYFHRLPEAKRDRKLWESLREISSTYRAYQCQKLIIEKLNLELDNAIKKRADYERSLENMISQAAFIYTTHEQPSVRADSIIHGDKDVSPEARGQILMNCKLYTVLMAA